MGTRPRREEELAPDQFHDTPAEPQRDRRKQQQDRKVHNATAADSFRFYIFTFIFLPF